MGQESISTLMNIDSQSYRLRRVADLNKAPEEGPGIASDHFVPLCKYYHRETAKQLVELLSSQGIPTETAENRMFVSVAVALNHQRDATRILAEFRRAHPDLKPNVFSRDYDLVFLIAVVSMFLAPISLLSSKINYVGPVAVIVSACSLSFVVERIHRQYRYYLSRKYSIKEVIALTALVAINLALWKLALV